MKIELWISGAAVLQICYEDITTSVTKIINFSGRTDCGALAVSVFT